MEEDEDIVTIKVTRKTREKLKTCGIKGESYESIVCNLIKEHSERRDKEV